MMTLKQKNSFILIVLLTANMALWATSNHIAKAQTCVGGGGLSISVPSNPENFGSMATSASNIIIDHTFASSISFADFRYVESGFILSVSATDFEDGDYAIDVTNIKMMTDYLSTIQEIACDDATGLTVSKTVLTAFEDGDDDGVSDDMTLVTSDNAARVGSYAITPRLELTIPSGTLVGVYSTTLNYTII